MSYSHRIPSLANAVLIPAIALISLVANVAHAQAPKPLELLNVSYDASRELYQDYNAAFARYWKGKTGQAIAIRQSHDGSGKQARAVIDGLDADVVTLALSNDVDMIAKKGLTAENWRSRFQNRSAPYTSTIVFLVRKGNPKKIKDWNDLVRSDVSVITVNPKTGGQSRWAYLAAYGYALDHNKNSDAAAREFIRKLYKNVPVLDAHARGATITFVDRGIGDVLLAYENEALLAQNKLSVGKVEVVRPSESIVTEPSIAVVDRNAAKHGTTELSTEYLKFWYSKEAQEIAARHNNRPFDPAVAAKTRLPKIKLFRLDDKFGNWENVQKIHFADGGVFDQLYSQ